MKFISKNSNLCVILRHSIPAEPLTGRQMQPALSVRFQNGFVDTNNQEVIDLMMISDAYRKGDFIVAEDGQQDPYYRGMVTEPEHDIQEIQFGQVTRNMNPKPLITVDPEKKKAIEAVAREMAKEMFNEMLRSLAPKAEQSTVTEPETPEVPVEEVPEEPILAKQDEPEDYPVEAPLQNTPAAKPKSQTTAKSKK